MIPTTTAKQLIRQEMRKNRRALDNQFVTQASLKLFKNLKPIIDKCENIAIYYAANNEISLQPVIEYLIQTNKQVYRPIAIKSSRIMKFELVSDTHEYDIFVDENYVSNQTIECYNLDLILLPLIAVNASGYRLGQGGGYYDNTLANNKTTILCGVGYQWQLINNLPYDALDVPLHIFANEQEILYFT